METQRYVFLVLEQEELKRIRMEKDFEPEF